MRASSWATRNFSNMGMPVYVAFFALFSGAAAAMLGQHLAASPEVRRKATALSMCCAGALAGICLWLFWGAMMEQVRFGWLTFSLVALALLYAHFALFASKGSAWREHWRGIVLGVALAALIPIGQVIAPSAAAIERARDLERFDSGKGASRVIRPYNSMGQALPVSRMPLLGSPDAPYIVVSFFDYTNDASRLTQRAMMALCRRFGDRVAVMPVLYPLDGGCNPKITPEIAEPNPDACAYARLSLAVWLAKPEAYAALHEMLVAAETRAKMPTVAQANDKAVELIGSQALESALADPALDELLSTAIRAKPVRLSSGLRDRVNEIDDVKPCTMWKALSERSAGVVTVGAVKPEVLLRQFEADTGALPKPNVETSQTSLMQLLKDKKLIDMLEAPDAK